MSAPTYSMERATAAAKALADAIRTADATAEDDLIADMIEGEGDAMAGVSRLLRWMAERNAYIAALKQTAADMAERRKRFEDGVDTARAALARFLDEVGLSRLERPEATLTMTARKAGANYAADFDAELLPEELRRWRCEADKVAVLAALEAGKTLPGVVLSNPQTTLTIRTK